MRLGRFAFFALLFFALQFFSISAVRAQRAYVCGVGAKVGSPLWNVSAKGFLGAHSALEGLVSLGGFGVGGTVLYEYHLSFPSVPGLRWYFGGGFHVATGRDRGYNPYADGHFSDIYAGVDGVLGVEYVFESVPLSISLDALPLLNFPARVMPWWNAGVSVRYLIR